MFGDELILRLLVAILIVTATLTGERGGASGVTD